MKMNFSNVEINERPILILKRADGTPIGVLGNAVNVEIEPNYNELSILSFELPAMKDGVKTPFYDELTGHKVIELKGIAQFSVTQPKESGDKINLRKSVQASSLECEFGRKKISLPESTYKFFDSSNRDGTVLGMIMELMPTWTVGEVASTLYNKYRTFEINGENLYNFIKGTLQEAYNCIFDFDTMNRVVHVRDADAIPAEKQVFLSRDNLARDIEVEELTDELVTRLDACGADGVDIRDVNPTGTNQILNLDYFMTTDNFSQTLINKYNAWKTLVDSERTPFYNYSIQYSMRISEELAENAKLADLQGELISLENVQAVIIQGIAAGAKTQADLTAQNTLITAKKADITAKQQEIAAITTERETVFGLMQTIRDRCAFENYFTEAERKTMDPYIRDDAVTESSFVASEVRSYTDGAGNKLASGATAAATGTTFEKTTGTTSTIYSLSGGTINIAGLITGTIVSSVFERRTDGKVVLSVYLSNGTYNGASFPNGCASVSGKGNITTSGNNVTCKLTQDGFLFFSLNASEYEKRTVAWELYEYGESLLAKMAVPTYSFSVDSANFIALEQFELFKNQLELGQRIYIQTGSGRILTPVCTGAKLKYHDRPYLELLFSDTFTANDGSSRLVDILDNSVSMGRTLSSGKFTYEAWTGSGASSELHNFITSALDTAKNAIMSSTDQAVSWDGAGFRMRKYSNDSHTSYDLEQIWINNNSILMTNDGWATAKMAIGKIHDGNVGDKWGIIAEMIVGTLIAGEELVIESQKKDGGTAVFRMDANGCRLYNSEFTIQKTNTDDTDNTTTQILLDPSVGVAMGTYPVTNMDGSINTTNAKFYVDPSGTMHLAGSITSYDGLIGGWTISQDGLYSGDTDATRVGMTSSGDIRIWAGNQDNTKAPFYVKQDGTMHSAAGDIGGWHIGTNYIGNNATLANSTVGLYSVVPTGTTPNVAIWAGGARTSAPFMVNTAGKVTASDIAITGGSITIKDGTTEKFKVTSAGAVTAADITITGGSITIKNGTTEKFKVTNKGAVTAADITITGGSITIKDGSTENFKVTSKGEITAIKGQIGGWYISNTHIGNQATSAASTVGLANVTSTGKVFWAGGTTPKFYVQANGKVYASDLEIAGGSITIKNGTTEKFKVTSVGAVTAADITITGGSISIKNSSGTEVFGVTNAGVMTAKSGSVGGWYFLTGYLGNASTKAKSSVGMAPVGGTSTDYAFWAGGTTPKFYVTGAGKLYANEAEFTTSMKIGNQTIGNYILDVSPKKISLLTFDSLGGSSSGIYLTPDQIQINTTGKLIISSGNLTLDQNGNGTVGGWSFSQYRLNSGSGYGYVAMDSQDTLINPNAAWNANTNDWVQPWAFWCGSTTASSAPFRVRRDGKLYINSLMIQNGSAWKEVDFSRDFSNAVSLKGGGSWSGNTFTATLKFFGDDNFTKSINISASVTLTDLAIGVWSDDTGAYGILSGTINRFVNGVKKSEDLYVDTLNVDSIMRLGWNSARANVLYTSGAKKVTVPKYISSGHGTSSDVEDLDITDTYEAGKREGKTAYCPDSISMSVNSSGQLCVTPMNAAGDSITGAMGTGYYRHTVKIGGHDVHFKRHSKDETPTGTWYTIVSSGYDLTYCVISDDSKTVYY